MKGTGSLGTDEVTNRKPNSELQTDKKGLGSFFSTDIRKKPEPITTPSKDEVEGIIFEEAKHFEEGKPIGKGLDQLETRNNSRYSNTECYKYDKDLRGTYSKNADELELLRHLEHLKLLDELTSPGESMVHGYPEDATTSSDVKSNMNVKESIGAKEMMKVTLKGMNRYQRLIEKANEKVDFLNKSLSDLKMRSESEILILKDQCKDMATKKNDLEIEKNDIVINFEELVKKKDQELLSVQRQMERQREDAEHIRRKLTNEEQILSRKLKKTEDKIDCLDKNILEAEKNAQLMQQKAAALEIINEDILIQIQDAKEDEARERQRNTSMREEIELVNKRATEYQLKLDAYKKRFAAIRQKDISWSEREKEIYGRDQDELLHEKEDEIRKLVSENDRLKNEQHEANIEIEQMKQRLAKRADTASEEDSHLEDTIRNQVMELEEYRGQEAKFARQETRLKSKELQKFITQTSTAVVENHHLKAKIKELEARLTRQDEKVAKLSKRQSKDIGTQNSLELTQGWKFNQAREKMYSCLFGASSTDNDLDSEQHIKKLQLENEELLTKIPNLDGINKTCMKLAEKALQKSEKWYQEKDTLENEMIRSLRGNLQTEVKSEDPEEPTGTKGEQIADTEMDLKNFQEHNHKILASEKQDMPTLENQIQDYRQQLEMKTLTTNETYHTVTEDCQVEKMNLINAKPKVEEEDDSIKKQMEFDSSMSTNVKQNNNKLRRRIQTLEKLLQTNNINIPSENDNNENIIMTQALTDSSVKFRRPWPTLNHCDSSNEKVQVAQEPREEERKESMDSGVEKDFISGDSNQLMGFKKVHEIGRLASNKEKLNARPINQLPKPGMVTTEDNTSRIRSRSMKTEVSSESSSLSKQSPKEHLQYKNSSAESRKCTKKQTTDLQSSSESLVTEQNDSFKSKPSSIVVNE